jgi:hypothetical protein
MEGQGGLIESTVDSANRHEVNRFWRILVSWDKNPEHYIAFLHFTCALNTFAPPGYCLPLGRSKPPQATASANAPRRT